MSQQPDDLLQTSGTLSDFEAIAREYRYEIKSQELEASLNTGDYVSRLEKLIQERHFNIETKKVGIVQHIGDGIATVSGLQEAMVNELLLFPNGVYGMALNLEENSIGCVLLGREEGIVAGDLVQGTGRVVEVPVGAALVGRVVNALGQSIDDGEPIRTDKYRPIESDAPMVIDRQPVQEPLQTGIKTIDAVIPLGRGQRELIIGDRQIGKTTIAVDTVINQRNSGVHCIYVCIGQKMNAVARMVNTLRQNGAMAYTTVVVAGADEPAVMLYLAPYAGCAMAEEIMYNGGHALIVYDDLSKHAMAYRELSLLLRRPPGREAYPGDIFYLHSRLLERAAKLNNTLGGGSLTALPIVETQAGNMSAYIPTNLISITDGQIYLSPSLFQQDIKPAIDVGLSVSRVGGAAQSRAMRAVSRHLKLDISQYLELQIFARFGTELDADTRQKLNRGQRVREVLRQPQNRPLSLAQQVVIIFAASEGFLDDLPLTEVRQFEQYLFEYMGAHHQMLMNELERGQWSRSTRDELPEAMRKCVEAYQKAQEEALSNG